MENTKALYLKADELQVGDILPDVSTSPVKSLTPFLNHLIAVFHNGEKGFAKVIEYGGKDFGWPAFRVIRVDKVGSGA